MILQMSKVDPSSLKGLDRKSTILLQASRQNVSGEKSDIMSVEEPGMDALRGSFGAFGSVIRARSVKSVAGGSQHRAYLRHSRGRDEEEGGSGASELTTRGLSNLPRTQLYDAPVPRVTSSLPDVPEVDQTSLAPSNSANAGHVTTSPRNRTISFEPTRTMHLYSGTPGKGTVIHEQQRNSTLTMSTQPGSHAPEYSDNEEGDEAFDPTVLPLEHTRGASDRFLHNPTRKDSGDPFRDVVSPNSSQANLISATMPADSGIHNSYSDREGASSPEESRQPFHSRTRAYPGRTSSSDDEEMARESLVAHDSGSTRGGIRLIPSKSPRKI